MQDAFQNAKVANNAFVFMAQSLCDGVPAFCLACVGTDNKFSADLILNRWTYIVSECKKRGITVASFGADGDSRELKAMQVSTSLLATQSSSASLSPSMGLKRLDIPPQWSSWFAAKKPTAIAYVQDTVHVAVKLKSRLIKPSIVLPLGKYLAGVHHLRQIQHTFGKDQHGLREKDLNHKDKQNFDAVLHLSSESVLELLAVIPDAKGTKAYLEVIQCVIVDKKVDNISRLEKAWYAVFFVRYWRQWLMLSPQYTLSNNFITTNAYVCIELNAHALITHLMTIRDTLPVKSFLPWLLGSQSCERIFRTARSLSSTFSTIINFGMLGLLRRLHRIHIQFCLEAESPNTGITYPRVEKHKKKSGQHNSYDCSVQSIANEDILEAIKQARERAKKTMEALGMKSLLQKNQCWENPPTPVLRDEEFSDDDDDPNQETVAEDGDPELLHEATLTDDPKDMEAGIAQLSSAGLIDKEMRNHLVNLHKTAFRRVTNSSVPLFEEVDTQSKKVLPRHKHSPVVAITHNGENLFINKTTAVWLLQENERVSTDRLFRVRAQQPYCSTPQVLTHKPESTVPVVQESIGVDDVCVFSDKVKKWKIGKVLQFSHYLEKTKSSRQYRGTVVNLSEKSHKFGVLCLWYESSSADTSASRFSLEQCESTHTFIPVTSYICTLTRGCFQEIERDVNSTVKDSVTPQDGFKQNLAMAQHLTLSADSLSFINQRLQTTESNSLNIVVVGDKDTPRTANEECWVEYGGICLTRKHMQQIINGSELTDLHVNAFQNLLKKNFPEIGGLQNTLYQEKTPLKLKECSLQVIHTSNSHWATLEIRNGDVHLYDSAYTSAVDHTLQIIAHLLHSKESCIQVQVMNTAKQTGSTDCGLYAKATLTCLALEIDPVSVVFDQEQLRTHMIKCMEKGE